MEADLHQLIQQLQDPSSVAQARATAAIEALRDPRALPELYLALRQEDAPREPLLRAMFRCAVAVPGAEVEAFWRVAQFAVEIVQPLPPTVYAAGTPSSLEGVSMYFARLANEQPGPLGEPETLWTRPILGTQSSTSRLEQQCAQLDVERPFVALALWAMGRLQEPSAGEVLCSALSEDHPLLRRVAAEALGCRRYAPAVGPLCPAMQDSSLHVRRSAAYAAAEIAHPDSVPCLLAALNDPDMGVQVQAARGLGRIGDPRALASLRPKARMSLFTAAQVRAAARAAIAEIEAQGGVGFPLPSEGPDAHSHALPRPASGPSPATGDLPHPADESPA